MPTPEWVKAASLAKRQRVCRVCGAEFVVRSADRVGATCSKVCQSKLNSDRQKGRKQSPETIAKRTAAIMAWRAANPEKDAERQAKCASKLRDHTQTAEFASRSSERMARRHTDPDWQKIRNARSSRVMLQNWEKHRDRYVSSIAARHMRDMQNGTGMQSSEAKVRKVEAARWIMKRAQEALRSETEYSAVFGRMLENLRNEFPYNGPGGDDYYEYLQKLCKSVVSSTDCRSIADPFLAAAIPRFASEWREMKKVQA